jgi:hypothetical protein
MTGRKRRADGNLDRRSARLTEEQRRDRNSFIFQAFLAGRPERWIAAHPKVGLTSAWVHGIIQSELQGAAKRQDLLTDHAKTIYVERLEMLISRAMPKVMEGDLKAVEVVRRVLDQQARFYDITEERGPMLVPPMSDAEMDDMDENSPGYALLDDLTKYRLRQQREMGGR